MQPSSSRLPSQAQDEKSTFPPVPHEAKATSAQVAMTIAATEEVECRICLQTDGEMVHPCGCSGTMSRAHLTCLTQWALEKRSLHCELCKQQYSEPFLTQIKAKLAENPRANGADPWGPLLVPSTQTTSPDLLTWHSVVCHVLILLMVAGVVLYITVFSSIAPSMASSWTGIVWRVLISVILGYLLGRCVAAIFMRWRAQRRMRQAQATQAGRELRALEIRVAAQRDHQERHSQGNSPRTPPVAPSAPPRPGDARGGPASQVEAPQEPGRAAGQQPSSTTPAQGAPAEPGHVVLDVPPQPPHEDETRPSGANLHVPTLSPLTVP